MKGRGRRGSRAGWEDGSVGKGDGGQGREGKRPRTNSQNSSNEEDMENFSSEGESREEGTRLVIRFAEGGGKGKMNSFKLTRELTGKCGELKYARVLGDGNLLAECSTDVQEALVRKLTKVGESRVVRVVRVGVQGRRCKGVITGIPMEVGDEELKEKLCARGMGIVNVKRMTRGPEKKTTETVFVEFEGEVIPDKVYLEYISYFVRAFIPKPMRCYKCQSFGHIARYCKENRRCARCTGDHEYGKCGEGTKPRCCSCGGET
ncbi:uncharacterized protein LOC123975742 [Xyrichtys novacula]|uniref:Uncharacterized protein LOC123975742 n=1 Tax=Xyrichtys novacula TaxID=13765 RepID=A0AAV1EXI6_XYRNO|nr:uncharacterized protein LOC123975742 [Xyrichtys novacula]